MQRVAPPRGKWLNIVFPLAALLIAIADQLSKWWIRANLTVGDSIPETGIFRLTHIHNTGIAFGLFQGHSVLFSIIASVCIMALLLFVLFFSHRVLFTSGRLTSLAFGLILGGMVGNLIDRLRLGYVTDFIDIGFWPSFNIADSAITVGVILFGFSLILTTRVKRPDYL